MAVSLQFRTAAAPANRSIAVPRALPQPVTGRVAEPTGRSRPRELRNTIALLIAILLISVISLLYMNQAGRLATSGYQISNLQQERDRLQRENQQLEVQLAHLHSLPYVEDIAMNKLQMKKGELARVQYVNLNDQQLAASR
jgi:cell division protein FtsL